MNEEWPVANPCSKCGRKPEQTKVFDLYYVQCRHCGKVEVSITKKIVTENWNSLYGRTTKHYLKTTPATDGGRSKSKTIKTK